MIRIALIGDVGSGKSYIAKLFGYPVFNADLEVAKIYRLNRGCFKKFKKSMPKYFSLFPINKKEIMKAILENNSNLRKITKIIHPEVKKNMSVFLKKHKKKKIVVLDIPLLLENKINTKKDILVFVKAKNKSIYEKLKKRKNFNLQLLKIFKKIQLPLEYKINKCNFVVNNNFTNASAKKDVKSILGKIL